jgi:hypothetical protein
MRKSDKNLFKKLYNNEVLFTPDFDAIRIWGQNLRNVYSHYDSYLETIKENNSFGCMEKHPYLDLYKDDFNLKRGILILGTFPPSSYFNNLPLNNLPNPNIQPNKPVNYYYGNVNDLWFYLFGLKSDEIKVETIRNLLSQNEISISDVIAYSQREIMNQSDDNNLKNIVVNWKIGNVFNSESHVHTILFTSGGLGTFLNNNTTALNGFRWILEDCAGGLSECEICGEISGNGHYFSVSKKGIERAKADQNGGIIWWIKKGDKKVRIINIPSPSPAAAIQMKSSPFFLKWINYMSSENGIQAPSVNDNLNNYLDQYPAIFYKPFTRQYRSMIYSKILNNTIDEIV